MSILQANRRVATRLTDASSTHTWFSGAHRTCFTSSNTHLLATVCVPRVPIASLHVMWFSYHWGYNRGVVRDVAPPLSYLLCACGVRVIWGRCVDTSRAITLAPVCIHTPTPPRISHTRVCSDTRRTLSPYPKRDLLVFRQGMWCGSGFASE